LLSTQSLGQRYQLNEISRILYLPISTGQTFKRN